MRLGGSKFARTQGVTLPLVPERNSARPLRFKRPAERQGISLVGSVPRAISVSKQVGCKAYE